MANRILTSQFYDPANQRLYSFILLTAWMDEERAIETASQFYFFDQWTLNLITFALIDRWSGGRAVGRSGSRAVRQKGDHRQLHEGQTNSWPKWTL